MESLTWPVVLTAVDMPLAALSEFRPYMVPHAPRNLSGCHRVGAALREHSVARAEVAWLIVVCIITFVHGMSIAAFVRWLWRRRHQ